MGVDSVLTILAAVAVVGPLAVLGIRFLYRPRAQRVLKVVGPLLPLLAWAMVARLMWEAGDQPTAPVLAAAFWLLPILAVLVTAAWFDAGRRGASAQGAALPGPLAALGLAGPAVEQEAWSARAASSRGETAVSARTPETRG